MKNYTLQRLSQSEEGTFGVLLDESGNIICHTCVLPPDDNIPDRSCIDAGTYTVIPHNGEEWKNVWEVSNVPGRSGILIHSGNTILDSKGCIIVGTIQGWLETQMAVLNSLAALNSLRNTLPSTFQLVIIDPI